MDFNFRNFQANIIQNNRWKVMKVNLKSEAHLTYGNDAQSTYRYQIEQTSNLTYETANTVFCFNAIIHSNTNFANSKEKEFNCVHEFDEH